MSNTRHSILASRPAATVLALSLVAGLSTPFVMLPRVHAAIIVPNGTTELSPTPVNQTTAVPPNVAVTFDDSGSMAWDYLSDQRPFDARVWWLNSNGQNPWYCAGVINPSAASGILAHVMNGVYYNPNVNYVPPVRADGGSFPNADATLRAVWNDGLGWNRELNPSRSAGTTDFSNQGTSSRPTYWQCPSDAGRDYNLGSVNNVYSTTVRVTGGGPYYYQYTGPAIATDQYGNPTSTGLGNLYNYRNWTAVAVPSSQYQNWANWWAYYRTRNQMARTALSRVFGSPALAATTATGGFGNDIRVAWQNLYAGIYGINDQFVLQANTIISALIDQNPANCNGGGTPPALGSQSLLSGTQKNPPNCYRSDFFNWIFQVPAQSGTPTRSALVRAGQFFQRGSGNTGTTGDLHDPYWQPPPSGAYSSSNPGNELYCRQNFHILITDGLWNYDQGLPAVSSLAQPVAGTTLPDGVGFPGTGAGSVTSIFAPQHNKNSDGTGAASLSDIAFHYWATNLRPDLYNPAQGQFVPPYLPDTYTGLFGGAGNVSGGYGNAQNIPAEEYFNPKNDPATWPHMSEYLIGLGVSGYLNFSENTDCQSGAAPDLDACDLRKGVVNSYTTGWPQPDSAANGGNGSPANIDDTWHAALAGRGQFFSAGNPQQLVDQLTSVLTSISARAANPATGAVNASVATVGALSFSTSYDSKNWTGSLQAMSLNSDGTLGSALWSASIPAASSRNIYTGAYSGGSFTGFAFTTGNIGSFDASENSAGVGLQSPALGSSPDSVASRINYLRGDQSNEANGATGIYRKRNSLLGAIINSQPAYVAYPSSNYYDSWPSGSPEAATGAQKYSAFVAAHATRAGTAYVGANDGMLHAFNAPVPKCTSYNVSTGQCSTYDTGSNPGLEEWAFIPRAVYANLGNLTNANNFQFRPTVDATPVTRDVFFSDKNWHTILTGGVGLGGRGVYALDITGAANSSSPATAPDKVLWEFDADMPASATCVSNSGNCRGTDLGYTVSQPNIGRLSNGEWVVLVSNGYFPDCSKPDIPTATLTACQTTAAQAPKDSSGNPYSALFVFDAQTGKMIAELKTPTGISGVTSFGLATPVLGDYNADQVDDVAFAGDLQGNLWRFDLSSANPSNWKVTLAYQGMADSSGNQGLQPITTMPRLFPDPATGSFMVVFGTGKYLGAGDNSSNAVQGIYGIRDSGACASAGGCAVTQSQLVQQTLAERTVNPPNPYQGATVRTDTDNAVPVGKGGWYIPLKIMDSTGTVQVNSGERVVVTPGAIFSSNMVIVQTLMAGAAGSDPCNPSTPGALMVFNTNNGGPGTGVSSLGGAPVVGGRINNARTSGSLPVVSALGGGQFYVPGVSLSNSTNTGPFTGDTPIWRRRSWSEINQ